MDITSLVGLVLGIVFVIGGSLSSTQYQVGPWVVLYLFQPASMMITFGGIAAATLLHYPLPQIMSIVPILKNVFGSRPCSRMYARGIL